MEDKIEEIAKYFGELSEADKILIVKVAEEMYQAGAKDLWDATRLEELEPIQAEDGVHAYKNGLSHNMGIGYNQAVSDQQSKAKKFMEEL